MDLNFSLSRVVPSLAGAALFCFCHAAGVAAGDSTDNARSTPSSDTAEAATSLEPIIIEGEGGELTPEQLRRKFGDALSQPSKPALQERRLDGGGLEVTTRFGRFCTRPMPAYLSSGLGGDIALLAPCAAY